jgi:hypothetical protein
MYCVGKRLKCNKSIGFLLRKIIGTGRGLDKNLQAMRQQYWMAKFPAEFNVIMDWIIIARCQFEFRK